MSLGVWPPYAGPLRYKTGRWYHCSPNSPTGNTVLTEAELRLMPFQVDRAQAFDRIAAEVGAVGTAGALVRLGIYRHDPSMTFPLVVDAGTIDGTNPGVSNLTIAQTLRYDLYWLALVAQGGAATPAAMVRYSGDGENNKNVGLLNPGTEWGDSLLLAGIAGALPATVTPVAEGSGTGYLMHLRAA